MAKRKFLSDEYNYILEILEQMLEKDIILPLPSIEFILKLEKYWRVVLPKDYKKFIMKKNGLIPRKNTFKLRNKEYIIERFLCVLENIKNNLLGMYDIDVVMTQLDERIFVHEDILGFELIPIAALFSGDFVCLNFIKDKSIPSLCIWYHEESYELNPTVEFLANNFTEFLEMLHE